jgi:Na+/H+ antiporter NhaD/arsenite permease-like protein
MLPYSAASLVLLLAAGLLYGRGNNLRITVRLSGAPIDRRSAALYVGLFAVSLLAVLRVIPYGVAVAVVLACVLAADRPTLREVDYSLLLTFIGFFVFIGNMGRIPLFRSFLERTVSGNEMLTAVLASQVISNVPAALLLSEFTDNLSGLIVGTDLGGLGTLIASMASLISYKLYAQKRPDRKGRYLLVFTAVNLAFLLVLVLLAQWI